jgi:subtilisin family serine protease
MTHQSGIYGALRRALVVFGLCFAATGCAEGIPPAVQVGQAAQVDILDVGTVYALVPDRGSSAALQDAASGLAYTFLEEVTLPGLGMRMLSFSLPEGVTGKQAIVALEAEVPAATVGVNHAYRLQQQAGRQGGPMDFANVAMNWTSGACAAAGPIGMIDTGLDADAPGLSGARVQTARFAEGPAAGTRHGTDVAMILADPTRITGAQLFAADVMTRDAQGLAAGAAALVRSLDWMAANEVRLVNLSLAGPYNKLLDLAVSAATERGAVLVAAVGNAGPRADALYPAGFDQVIAVTAVDARQRAYRNAVRGAHVDVAAPGVDVFVPSPEGGRFVTGTSVAAPFVTARIAADSALYASADAVQIVAALQAEARDLGPDGADETFGIGLVQAPSLCGAPS